MKRFVFGLAAALLATVPALAQEVPWDDQGRLPPVDQPFTVTGWAGTGSAEEEAARVAEARRLAATEQAFAAWTAEHGITAGFVKYAAPDGIVFRPGAVNARAFYTGAASQERRLRWGPARVIMSRSLDLGFTIGPWTFGDGLAHGWFVTVWQRQPDGQWRWLLDHGAGETMAGTPFPALDDVAIDSRTAALARNGFGGVETMDDRETARLKEISAPYNGTRRFDGGWSVHQADLPGMELAARDPDSQEPWLTSTTRLGGAIAIAGDLAYTYGTATWTDGGVEVQGVYLRLWRHDGRGDTIGWRITYDVYTPDPPPGG